MRLSRSMNRTGSPCGVSAIIVLVLACNAPAALADDVARDSSADVHSDEANRKAGLSDRRQRWKDLPRHERKALRRFYSELSDEARERFLRRFENLDPDERARALRRARQVLGALSADERQRLLDNRRPRDERVEELNRTVDERKHRLIEDRRRFVEARRDELPAELQERIRDWPIRRQAGFVHRYLANRLLTESFPDENARQRLVKVPRKAWKQLRAQPGERPEGFPQGLWESWSELEPRVQRMLRRQVHHVRHKARMERVRRVFRQAIPDRADRRSLMQLDADQVRALRQASDGDRPEFLDQSLWQRWGELEAKQKQSILRMLRHKWQRKRGPHGGRGPFGDKHRRRGHRPPSHDRPRGDENRD